MSSQKEIEEKRKKRVRCGKAFCGALLVLTFGLFVLQSWSQSPSLPQWLPWWIVSLAGAVLAASVVIGFTVPVSRIQDDWLWTFISVPGGILLCAGSVFSVFPLSLAGIFVLAGTCIAVLHNTLGRWARHHTALIGTSLGTLAFFFSVVGVWNDAGYDIAGKKHDPYWHRLSHVAYEGVQALLMDMDPHQAPEQESEEVPEAIVELTRKSLALADDALQMTRTADGRTDDLIEAISGQSGPTASSDPSAAGNATSGESENNRSMADERVNDGVEESRSKLQSQNRKPWFPWIPLARSFAILLALFLAYRTIFHYFWSSSARLFIGIHAIRPGIRERLVALGWPLPKWAQKVLQPPTLTLICGLGRIGLQLVRELEFSGSEVIVLEQDENNPNIAEAIEHGAILLVGDASDRDLLKTIYANAVEDVFVVAGSDDANITIASELHEEIICHEQNAQNRNSTVYVQIYDPLLARVLHRSFHTERKSDDSKDNASKSTDAEKKKCTATLRIFNLWENTARDLIQKHLCQSPYRPQKENEVALYVIVGFGPMGQEVALRLAQLAHFENGRKSRILVLDDSKRSYEPQTSRFLAQWPRFCNHVGPVDSLHDRFDRIFFDPSLDTWGQRSPTWNSKATPFVRSATNAVFARMPRSPEDTDFLKMMSRITTTSGGCVVRPNVIVCLEPDRKDEPVNESAKQPGGNDVGAFAWAEAFEHAWSRHTKQTSPKSRGVHALPVFVWLPRHESITKVATQSGLIPFGGDLFQNETGGDQANQSDRCVDSIRQSDMEKRVEQIKGAWNAGITEPLLPPDELMDWLWKNVHLELPFGPDANKESKSTDSEYLDAVSNGLAADHASIKITIDAEATDKLAIKERLAHAEHNRWCAEHMLRDSLPVSIEGRTARIQSCIDNFDAAFKLLKDHAHNLTDHLCARLGNGELLGTGHGTEPAWHESYCFFLHMEENRDEALHRQLRGWQDLERRIPTSGHRGDRKRFLNEIKDRLEELPAEKFEWVRWNVGRMLEESGAAAGTAPLSFDVIREMTRLVIVRLYNQSVEAWQNAPDRIMEVTTDRVGDYVAHTLVDRDFFYPQFLSYVRSRLKQRLSRLPREEHLRETLVPWERIKQNPLEAYKDWRQVEYVIEKAKGSDPSGQSALPEGGIA